MAVHNIQSFIGSLYHVSDGVQSISTLNYQRPHDTSHFKPQEDCGLLSLQLQPAPNTAIAVPLITLPLMHFVPVCTISPLPSCLLPLPLHHRSTSPPLSPLPPVDLTAFSEGAPVPFSLKRRALCWQVEHNGCCLPSPSSASRTE